ncbi:10825_t:CDS:2 [Funneliformis caledonium]|uniref:10825_t:CDS:1 n=1 Tax=Funneliformis caledonium TaxID=1117310 RepID=A0A9N9ABZ3_9GLOM|nr:10825_t:CDS:2 [Funneliformis caledonium]
MFKFHLKYLTCLASANSPPDPRVSFAAIKNLQVGQHSVLPNFGQEPKHFAKGYLGRKLYVTNRMINVWNDISKDQLHSFKRVLSGPMGTQAELDVDTPEEAGEVICNYFLALNRDILTGDELDMLVEIAKHGVLFKEDPPVPKRLHFLSSLMNLTFWVVHYKGVHVIFTGTAHANPLENNMFDMWLETHPLLKISGIKVKEATNCIPHELMYLVGYVNEFNVNTIDVNFFQQILNN